MYHLNTALHKTDTDAFVHNFAKYCPFFQNSLPADLAVIAFVVK